MMSGIKCFCLFSPLFVLLSMASCTSAFVCSEDVGPFELELDLWSGLFRYTMVQGTYPELGIGAADCQLKYWQVEEVHEEMGHMLMNKTYRFVDGDGHVVTDSFIGHVVPTQHGQYSLQITGGDKYTIAFVATDYENYAAYVECSEDDSLNFPVISSTSNSELDDELVASLVQRFEELGANVDALVQVVHDDNCLY